MKNIIAIFATILMIVPLQVNATSMHYSSPTPIYIDGNEMSEINNLYINEGCIMIRKVDLIKIK